MGTEPHGAPLPSLSGTPVEVTWDAELASTMEALGVAPARGCGAGPPPGRPRIRQEGNHEAGRNHGRPHQGEPQSAGRRSLLRTWARLPRRGIRGRGR
ncbi:hypothetical protein ABT147_24170 [Streptomyces sp. NPDC001868]|uniref:hypothetical protein n=1 Tax=Streptomyces sp. NPDC001868 TaxID=3154401 RepID=UPI003319F88D